MNPIYLDHNATTTVLPEALEAMLPYFSKEFGNASSAHQYGQHARKAVEQAREECAAFIGAESADEILFTSGGTESNNTAIKGAIGANRSKARRVVSSAIEHSSIRNVVQHLAEKNAADNAVVPVNAKGIVQLDQVDAAIILDTALVTIMAANNEIGSLQPVKEIAALCKKKNVLFHTDAVQMAGKMAINVKDWGVDMLSLSGHKFGAPKGVGVLYIRKGTRLESLIEGGRHEKNRRGGTENVPSIVAMGTAARLSAAHIGAEAKEMQRLRDLFEKEILSKLPLTSVNGDLEHRIANTTNICFEYTDSTQLLMALDIKGLACSSGSACAAGSADPSHVLLAMGLPQEKAHASLRFSLGHTTTEAEIRSAIDLIVATVPALRKTNPLWKEASNK